MNWNSMTKIFGTVTILTILAKIFGFIREALIAAYFGVTSEADAYFIAAVIPTMLFATFASAISNGLIPYYKKQTNLKNIEFITTLFLLISIFITIVSWMFAPTIVGLFAPGFDKSTEALTVTLTRVMLPALIFQFYAAMATGVLQANQRFTLPAAKTLIQNLVVIIFVILFSGKFGIYSLAIGTALGLMSQFFIQYPEYRKYKVKYRLRIENRKNEVKNILNLFFPIIISSMIMQINEIVDRVIASGLIEGSVSSLNYGSRVMNLPLSIIVMSFITIFYPSIVERFQTNKSSFYELTRKHLKIVLLCSIPMAIILYFCSEQLIRIAFMRESFNEEAVYMTTVALKYYTIGLPFIALREYYIRVFFAMEKGKKVTQSSIVMVIVNIILSVILAKYHGHGGIALATSISVGVQVLLLVVFYKLEKIKSNSSM